MSGNPTLRRLMDLTADELRSLPRDRTAFWIPVGALEDHGPHLPMGADLMEAEFLCIELSERLGTRLTDWNWILCPALPASVDAATTETALTTRAHVVRDYLVDTCDALARNGFLFFGVISGTMGPRQLVAIEDAGRLVRKKHAGGVITRHFRGKSPKPTLFCPTIALVSREQAMRSPLYPTPEEHGGRADTSLILALEPGRVRDSARGLPAATRDLRGWEYLRARLKRKVRSYVGAPALATAEEGHSLLAERVDAMASKSEAVLRGEKAEWVLRSWYSVFPPNRSFFRAWCLALSIGIVLAAWVALTISWTLSF